MPVVTPTRVRTPHDVDYEVWLWSGLGQGDTGAPVITNYKQDKAVYYKASTPGTGTLAIEGTPDPGPPGGGATVGAAGFAVLHDTRGPSTGDLTGLALATTMTTRQVLEVCYAIRPNLGGGAGASGCDVWLLMRGR